MKTAKIKSEIGDSVIMIGERLENLNKHLPVKAPIIITDNHVRDLWGGNFPQGAVITIGTGEKYKSLDTAGRIYRELVELEADRTSRSCK